MLVLACFADLLVLILVMFCCWSDELTGWIPELGVGLVMAGEPGSCSVRQLLV